MNIEGIEGVVKKAIDGVNLAKWEVYGIIAALTLATAGLAYWWAWHNGYQAAEKKYEAKIEAATAVDELKRKQLLEAARSENPEMLTEMRDLKGSVEQLKRIVGAPQKQLVVYDPRCVAPQSRVDEFNAKVEAANAR